MAYRFLHDETISQGVKRIAEEQLDDALAELQNREVDCHETIHQVRKRFKKLRGLIRLVRPGFEKTYQYENANFRDVGRELSAIRDAQSLVEAFDRLISKQADSPLAFAQIRECLVNRRTQIVEHQADLSDVLESLSRDIMAAKTRIADWKLHKKGVKATLAGFEKTYARGQQNMDHASRKKAKPEDFHEWRKRVKYHWYHCRLLENLWKPVLRARRDEAKRLAELLGEDHDLALLDQLLDQHGEIFPKQAQIKPFRQLIRDDRRKVQQSGFGVGGRLFAEKPKHLSRRLLDWWSLWKEAA